jgi:Ca2+-transporting ATPase
VRSTAESPPASTTGRNHHGFEPPPHAADVGVLARDLRTDAQSGLSVADARRRLARAGANRLPAPARTPSVAIAARQLADPLVLLLLGATAASVLVGERLEALVIASVVVLNAALGFVQEAGAERAVQALRGSIQPVASVVRGGRERAVPADEVVPGDLLLLREGDRVPADARVTDHERLEIDESALTGESLPVAKTASTLERETPLADRASMVFAGTGVTCGGGRAIVVATGRETELGRIAALTAASKPPATPLQRQLGRLSRVMVALGVAVTATLTLGMLARGASPSEAFLVGVSVAVAAVPEGLAATVTIALAQGARHMAARGAIVRRLAAVETLGAATVIAADKTGTLTVNQLRVARVEAEPDRTGLDVLRAAVLASTAELLNDDDAAVHVAGDPVDGAFLLALRAEGVEDPRASTARARLHVVPFDPWRKRLTTVYAEREGRRVLVKGAPETLVQHSRLESVERMLLLDKATRWASDGLRVLAVGERLLASDEVVSDGELDSNLDILGLVGLRDPLRATAAESIRRARLAGVEVAILTGDHPVTAAAIARSLDLPDSEPLRGSELEELDERELATALSTHSVFARVTPADKLRLVAALQASGHVVAVTGDGVNDSPALRRADVGVAMGAGGTEAARESADVVLVDDDFATIVAAIAEGRRIADNIRNFVSFLLSANLGEVLLFAVAIVAGIGAPLTVVQVLTVNLLTDGLPAIALSRDPAAEAPAAPRGHRSLFPPLLPIALGAMGFAVGLSALAAYAIGRSTDVDTARTMAFSTLALAELVLVFSIRSGMAPPWRGRRNPLLLASVAVSFAFLVLSISLPAAREAFDTQPLSTAAVAIVVVLALAPALATEVTKALLRRTAHPHSPARRFSAGADGPDGTVGESPTG